MGVWIETVYHGNTNRAIVVTPCMGVWIETPIVLGIGASISSHPVWVCGLKRLPGHRASSSYYVTPCMGVWIETTRLWMIS